MAFIRFNFMGVKGAKVPLRKVGDGWPLTEVFLYKKFYTIDGQMGLSLWNVGEKPGDENASAMRDGIPAVFQA